ncbi:MAG: response regulator [Gammaproteobacteria bacterium]|jgi:two-component system, NarL family, invasion response regulator UvrY
MIRVMLVDDHELVRTGFRLILDDIQDIEVVAEASTGESALQQIPEVKPDLVLMDVNMPGMGGIEATRKIKRKFPDIQVIAITVHANAPFPAQLHEAGAMGYLTKGCPAVEMMEAIRTVVNGKPYLSSEVAKKLSLAKLTGIDTDQPFASLSKREMQVLMLIVQGAKNQDISDTLCVSPKTISTYRHRLFEKLGIDTDAELTMLAIRHGIAEFEA